MATMNRILIVDNHAPFRSTLRKYLSQEPDFLIVGVAGNLRDAVWYVGSLRPDLVLTDLTMPDARGVEAVAEIKRHYPEVKVLVLSLHSESEYKLECRNAGADGYIVKSAIRDELCDGIRTVLGGKTYLGARAANGLVTNYLPGSAASDRGRSPFPLSLSLG